MSMKKKALAAASYVMVAALAIGGTVAYLTDTDDDINVMTVGNVKIEQHEQERDGSDFEQNQTVLPIVTPANKKDEAGYPACDNYVDKIVTVENTGRTDAWVRTIIAIPEYTYEGDEYNNASANVLHWNGYSEGDASPNYPVATKIPGTNKDVDNHWYWGQNGTKAWPGNGGPWNWVNDVVIDGQEYTLMIVTHTTVLKAGEITAPNMIGLYLDSKVDYNGEQYTIDGEVINGFDGTIEVLVASQAVQADGFDDAWTALEAGFGDITTTNHPWYGKDLVVDSEDDLANASGSVAIEEDMVLTGTTTELKSDANIILAADVTAERSDATAAGAASFSVLTVYDDVTLDGTGSVENTGTGYAISVRDKEASLTINGGTYKGAITAINVVKGDLVISGGFFEDTNRTGGYTNGSGEWVECKNGHFLINMNDTNRKNGEASVTITGGTFVNFNPANNAAEGAGTNFVADGYKVVEEKQANGDVWYTVVAE